VAGGGALPTQNSEEPLFDGRGPGCDAFVVARRVLLL